MRSEAPPQFDLQCVLRGRVLQRAVKLAVMLKPKGMRSMHDGHVWSSPVRIVTELLVGASILVIAALLAWPRESHARKAAKAVKCGRA